MWKKSEAEASSQTTAKRPTPTRAESAGTRKARIGAGLLLKGELYGEEDVIIEGRVEGKITLKQHSVIIEESGRIDADITANSICVAGECAAGVDAGRRESRRLRRSGKPGDATGGYEPHRLPRRRPERAVMDGDVFSQISRGIRGPIASVDESGRGHAGADQDAQGRDRVRCDRDAGCGGALYPDRQ